MSKKTKGRKSCRIVPLTFGDKLFAKDIYNSTKLTCYPDWIVPSNFPESCTQPQNHCDIEAVFPSFDD